ncbi:unnamed protein product [Lasius platythorax]|uniref:Uncharacterized protein n=1 Tax=Lasius platythorax TaxID=488582 RepID=A0AAV2NIW7_9HYME
MGIRSTCSNRMLVESKMAIKGKIQRLNFVVYKYNLIALMRPMTIPSSHLSVSRDECLECLACEQDPRRSSTVLQFYLHISVIIIIISLKREIYVYADCQIEKFGAAFLVLVHLVDLHNFRAAFYSRCDYRDEYQNPKGSILIERLKKQKEKDRIYAHIARARPLSS